MKLLYICTYQFIFKNGFPCTVPAYGDGFWDQFTESFDSVDVIGEPLRDEEHTLTIPITRKDISVSIIPANARPFDIRNDAEVKKQLETAIMGCECVMIKIASRKANMAIKLAKKYGKPYMIGVTGDLYRDLITSKSVLRRLYAPIIYKQSLKTIKDCKFGTYVTQKYLQSMYPIEGMMCGYTDTLLPYVKEEVLESRLEWINGMQNREYIDLGIIGTYHDNRKGYDTAIQALEKLNNPRVRLRILGVGTSEDQHYWISYGMDHGIKNVIFDKPVSGVENVFKWIDSIDISILPSRSEGLPRSIVESISRACPCVISNVCGMPELVNEKWLHNPEDDDKLAELLSKMIEDEGNMIEAAKENFHRALDYTLDSVRKKRTAFYDAFKEYVNSLKK